MAQVWVKYDCNPMKSLVGTLGQASVFMTFFFALKALAAAKVDQLPWFWKLASKPILCPSYIAQLHLVWMHPRPLNLEIAFLVRQYLGTLGS